MIEWWRRVTKRESPRERYDRQRRGGADPEDALLTVALSYGLETTIVRLTGDGKPVTVHAKWTLAQIDRLLFLKWERDHGRIGGPGH